ncbi:MAG: WecB/TagA/CpsF family glycosyltransferase [Microbacteriaceae bacterium]|nr:WecB/TagA/CpsF family glycosyltransferase [Microbacteriaceae bacterium]MCL2793675.1 WecB/TagA/CpsF family glycosyltransferase [Microbacteriaceae bacterium]
MTLDIPRIRLGGSPVDLLEFDQAVDLIGRRARSHDVPPLGVVSINLDHIHHFGQGAPLSGDFGMRPWPVGDLEWLNLADGAPLVEQARRTTAHSWPRLAGSDLIGAVLERCERDGVTVGFLGGLPAVAAPLRAHLHDTYPGLEIGGFWTPARDELADARRSSRLAEEIRSVGVDVLVVCLGKPLQELWIDHYGARTGASVLLAFGAVVDFLAGRVERAPHWASDNGLEWAWRLAHEPKRLFRRYVIQGPSAYRAVRRSTGAPA